MQEKIELALSREEIPLEALLTMIDSGLIAAEYPELLEKWYPGFPGIPRAMNESDPFCVDGVIKGEFVIIQDMPSIGKLHVPGVKESEFKMGKCKVWLKKEGNEWTVTLQPKE